MQVKEKAKAAKGGKRTRMSISTTPAPVERKEAKKKRRLHMKELIAKLVSLIPKEHCSSTDTYTLLGSLEEATTYITKLKDRVDHKHLANCKVKEKAKAAKGGKRTRMSSSTTPAPVERKEAEKERRLHMKELIAKLVSLIPKEHCSSTDTYTLLGSLEEATTYITKLKDRVDKLHKRRSSAQAIAGLGGGGGGGGGVVTGVSTPMNGGRGLELEGENAEKELVQPIVEVRHHDDWSMDVMLICSVHRHIKLHEVITILEEEGAEIININHSVTGSKIFYNIHYRAFSSRIGIDVSRVLERVGALLK